MEGSAADEVILAEEEAVVSRGVGVRQEIESDLDVGKATEGNLVLTDQRLVYVHGGETEVDVGVGMVDPFETLGRKRLYIADVEDLERIPSDPANITIRLSSVVSVKGHHTPGLAPKLEVSWNENGTNKRAEFVEQETGRSRERNLNDWARVIERLKEGKQVIVRLPPPPDRDSLEGRILQALSDMQEKGVMTIDGEVEKRFGVDLDPDEVREACEHLASQGLILRTSSPQDEPFYVKVSPLGDDDLNR